MKTILTLLLLSLSATQSHAATCSQVDSFDKLNLVPNGVVLFVPSPERQLIDQALHLNIRIKEFSGPNREKHVYPMRAVPYPDHCQGADDVLAGVRTDKALLIHQDWGSPKMLVSWVKIKSQPKSDCATELDSVIDDSEIPMICEGDLFL